MTVCLVDSKNLGYQCSNETASYSKPLRDSGTLACTSPLEVEKFLKACQAGQVLPITLCRYKYTEFECTAPNGSRFSLAVLDANNYVCLDDKDRTRIQERCLSD